VIVILASDIKKGTKLLIKDQPFMVVDYQHVKPGKGGAFLRTKMKNMITGLMHEETFRSEEKIPTPDLEYRDMQYLYSEGALYNFMDQENFEQVSLDEGHLGEVMNLLQEQIIYTVLYFKGQPVAVTPPTFMEMRVLETVPGVKGDTAQGTPMKPAKTETGLTVQVPLFVNEGDIVKVDTRDLRYIERVNKK
jgi:elongation factor P